MNETLDLFCTEYINNKNLMIEDEIKRQKAEQLEKARPVGVAWLVLLVLALTIYLILSHRKASKKSKLVGPVKRTPTVPFSLNELIKFQTDASKNGVIPQARILCEPSRITANRPARSEVNKILRKLFNVMEDPIPYEARLISIQMENFKHGLKCHDFEPIDGEAPGSYYTYQMFGDNRIQVTNYVENGISYVAGFCIYMEDLSWGVSFREEVISNCINSLKYPGNKLGSRHEKVISLSANQKIDDEINESKIETRNINAAKSVSASLTESKKHSEETVWLLEETSNNTPNLSSQVSQLEEGTHTNEIEWTVKHCSKLRRMVMSRFKCGKIIHQEWNPNSNEMKFKECQVCLEHMKSDQPPTYSSLSIV